VLAARWRTAPPAPRHHLLSSTWHAPPPPRFNPGYTCAADCVAMFYRQRDSRGWSGASREICTGHKTAYVRGRPLYAVSPLTFDPGDQGRNLDPIITAPRECLQPSFSCLGRSRSAPILAGLCLGLLLQCGRSTQRYSFARLPLLAAPRQCLAHACGFAVTVLTLLLHLLWDSRRFTPIAVWQMSHRAAALDLRIVSARSAPFRPWPFNLPSSV